MTDKPQPAQPGKRYLFVVCPKCRESILFAEAPEPPHRPQLPTKLILTCPLCGHTAEHDRSQVAITQKR
jgi:hypothetical protein